MIRRNETIILAALICFAAGCILSMVGGTSMVLRDEVMPADVYSNILAVMLAVACVVRIITLYRSRREPDTKVVVFTQSTILIAFVSLVYTVGITSIGFYVSTFVCMLVLYLGFENWNKGKIFQGLAFSIGLCIVFYITFTYMKIYLPDGILF